MGTALNRPVGGQSSALGVTLLMIAVALAALAVPSAAQAYTCGAAGEDDFQRPSGTNLGPKWIERNEDWFISTGGRAFHESPVQAVATFVGADARDASVCVDVNRGGATGYRAVGVALNYKSLSDANIIRVHTEGIDAKFNSYKFQWNGVIGEGVGHGTIETPFDEARLHVTQIGTVATLEIDLNYDGIAEETYSADYAQSSATGTGVGIYSNGPAGLDNFRWGPILPPETPGGGPGGGSPSPTTPAVEDVTKPALGALGLSSATFRAAKSGASISAKRKSKAKVGTEVTYRLSELATVAFTVERKTTGRRASGKCRATTRKNARNTKCTRYVKVPGSFNIDGKAGENTFTFRGRMGGKSLKPASYRLKGTATDPARNASAPKQKAFKIVK
jgi:hypothetical protein